MTKADLKKLVDDASDASTELGFFMSKFPIDVRNVARDIQAYDNVDLDQLLTGCTELKEKSDRALTALRALYKAARERYGKEAA